MTTEPTLVKGLKVSSAVMTRIENERDTEAKDKKFGDIYDVKYQNLRLIHNVTYLKNYEATGL
jgi:hypothetical protein